MENDRFRTTEIAPAQTSAQNTLARNLIEEQLDRLKLVTNSKTKKGLATILGITPQAILYATQKSQLPPSWFITIANKYNLSLDWLVYGQGSMKRGEEAGTKRKDEIKGIVEPTPGLLI